MCFHCSSPGGRKCVICKLAVCDRCAIVTGCRYPQKDPLGPEIWCAGQFTREGPPFEYVLTPKGLALALRTFGVIRSNIQEKSFKYGNTWGRRVSGDLVSELIKTESREIREKIFNAFRKYEIPSSEQTKKFIQVPVEDHKMVRSPFTTLKVEGLFFNPDTDKYFTVRLVITKSLIEAAGMGVFAEEEIPKGAFAYYRGEIKNEETHNGHYSWTVRKWDYEGFSPDEADPVYYQDATELKTSNWCRYVNCPNHGVKCNIEVDQYYGHVRYVASENIAPGDELFIDYGPEYRVSNIGIKTKNYERKIKCENLHFLERMKDRGSPQDAGFPEKEILPRMNLFECRQSSCQLKYFFCDGCEKAHPLHAVDLFCLECSTMFCEQSRAKKACHESM